MPGTTRGSGKHRLHALVGTARGHVALPALPGRRLGRGRWRTASPPAEPRALVLGAPPTALLLLRVFRTLANCTSRGRTLSGRMGEELGTNTGLSPRKPGLRLCCPRLQRVRSQEQLSPQLQLWRTMGLGRWTGCRGRRWNFLW